jgi:hypothetical protein
MAKIPALFDELRSLLNLTEIDELKSALSRIIEQRESHEKRIPKDVWYKLLNACKYMKAKCVENGKVTLKEMIDALLNNCNSIIGSVLSRGDKFDLKFIKAKGIHLSLEALFAFLVAINYSVSADDWFGEENIVRVNALQPIWNHYKLASNEAKPDPCDH